MSSVGSERIVTLPYPTTLGDRLWDVFKRTYDLGFTAFGGPPVHYQILHRRFVDGKGGPPWIDEQTYQELFSISQALPGPASTKMTFCIALIHAGLVPALFVFFLWCFPGAIGMYGLSLGIQKVDQYLPGPVYALLSGLNASTVGIVALAAVQLARKSITDPLTRILVLFGGCAGLCYNALWYFPIIIIAGGVSTLTWDHFLKFKIRRLIRRFKSPAQINEPARGDEENEGVPMETSSSQLNGPSRRAANNSPLEQEQDATTPAPPLSANSEGYKIPVKVGLAIIVGFFGVFTTMMVVRGLVPTIPLEFRIFTNMFLAGTIIFGGGPVVVPLLREYVVEPGWVTPRDFLIGLAIIQAFPGPNFNFAVYLCALALQSTTTNTPTIVGALLGFIGIFFPGIVLVIGFHSIWRALRANRFVASILRGINATAVGLVFTAVHRLWEIGFLTPDDVRGKSLGTNPWWVVIAATTYTAVDSFSVPTPVAIVVGGAMGLAWYGAIGRA